MSTAWSASTPWPTVTVTAVSLAEAGAFTSFRDTFTGTSIVLFSSDTSSPALSTVAVEVPPLYVVAWAAGATASAPPAARATAAPIAAERRAGGRKLRVRYTWHIPTGDMASRGARWFGDSRRGPRLGNVYALWVN